MRVGDRDQARLGTSVKDVKKSSFALKRQAVILNSVVGRIYDLEKFEVKLTNHTINLTL